LLTHCLPFFLELRIVYFWGSLAALILVMAGEASFVFLVSLKKPVGYFFLPVGLLERWFRENWPKLDYNNALARLLVLLSVLLIYMRKL
jgi:hypothetical protein